MKATNRWVVLIVVIVVAALVLSFGWKRSATTELFAQASVNNDPLHPVDSFVVTTDVTTLASAFQTAHQTYYPEDHIAAFPDPSLGVSSVVRVERALAVTITDGKKTYNARTWASTVSDLLEEKHIELGDQDKITPSLTTPLGLNTTVVINRVARTTVTEKEVVPFQTQQIDDPNSWRGTQTVIQQGANGERTKQYLLIREDGELKSKTLLSDTLATPPVTKKIFVGTKLKIGDTYTGKATYYQNSLGTKVASDKFKRGTVLRITNQNNGKQIVVTNDGCICGNDSVLVDLNPAYFQQLGGTLGQGVLGSVLVEEVLNW